MSDPSIPDYTFANDLGYIREEGVFSNVDSVNFISCVGASNSKKKTVVLDIEKSITTQKHRSYTTSLVDTSTGASLVIPPGSIIKSFVVGKQASKTVDPALQFYLGFQSQDLSKKTAKRAFAQIITAEVAKTETEPVAAEEEELDDASITSSQNKNSNSNVVPIKGDAINFYNSLHFKFPLGGKIASQLRKLILEDSGKAADANGTTVELVEYEQNLCLGLPISLMPSITVKSGNLHISDLTFTVTYVEP